MAHGFPTKGGVIHALYGMDGREMAKKLLDAGGVGRALGAGVTVRLKPNLVVARPAAEGATTHPEIVEGCIEFVLDHGAKAEIVEGSWLGDDTGRAFAVSGLDALGKRYGVKLFDLKKDATVNRDTPVGPMRICRRALEADFLINLPVLKGHCQTRMTCALKNMKGCLPDSEKRRFHRDGLDECIAALATAIVPSVTLVDGLCGDLDFEEGGNPVFAGRMLLGADPVKLDAYVCQLMGLATEDVGYLPLAASYGVGELTISDADIVELNRPVAGEMPHAAGKVAKLARHLQADQACSACYANAIHALKRLDEEGGLGRLPRLFIGQGWEGKQADGVGIGACCVGTGGQVKGCPPDALAIVETLRKARK